MTTPHPVLPAASASAPIVSASLGRRVGAYVVDVVIAAVIAVVVLVAGGAALAGTIAHATTVAAIASALLVEYAALAVVSLVWALVYTLLQATGGSPGQRMVGVRLVDAASGGRVGFGRALLRNVIWALAGSIVVGYFSPLFDPSPARQGWHDRVARVIVAPRAAAPAPVASTAPAPMAPPAPPNPFLAGVAAPAPLSFAPSSVAPATSIPAAAAPALTAPAAAPARTVVAQTGLIAVVPGVSRPGPLTIQPEPGMSEPSRSAAPQPAAAQPAPPTQPVGTPQPAPPAQPAHDLRAAPPASAVDVDETRAAIPRALVQLVWDDGTRVAVHGRTLFGRNPDRAEGVAVVPVRDETLSLSKTHFEIGGDPGGAWVRDLHSTNGTTILRDGVRERLVAGAQVPLRAGDRIELGDRGVLIESA